MNVYVVMESTRSVSKPEQSISLETINSTYATSSVLFIYGLEEDAIKRVAQLEKDRDDELMPNIVGYYYTIKEVL